MLPVSLEQLVEVAKQASKLMLARRNADDVTAKGESNFVTETDIAVQGFVKESLSAICPDCRFIGEEDDTYSYDPSAHTFIIDPIDGTYNFMRDFRMSAVSIAYVLDGESIMGVVYNPYTDEIFSAEKGKGAYLNGNRIHVSNIDKPSEALTEIGTMPYDKKLTAPYFDKLYKKIFTECVDIRRMGCASVEMCYIAAGRADCFLEGRLFPWDIAAARLIVAEAGGTVTRWNGDPTAVSSPGNVAASNGRLHSWLLKTLQENT